MNLLGVDVGYSRKKPTTGIAWRVADEISTYKTGTRWEELAHSGNKEPIRCGSIFGKNGWHDAHTKNML